MQRIGHGIAYYIRTVNIPAAADRAQFHELVMAAQIIPLPCIDILISARANGFVPVKAP